MLSDSVAALDRKLWMQRMRNGLDATERQTVGLAIDSEVEVFKAWSLVGPIELGLSSEVLIARDRCAKSPNDPKLSDGGAVRCSAWLGDFIGLRTDARKEFRDARPDSRWMPERECLESLDSVWRTRWRTAKNRRCVETLGAAAREACGPDRLAIDAEQECRRTRWRLTPG